MRCRPTLSLKDDAVVGRALGRTALTGLLIFLELRRLRLLRGIGQTELARRLQLGGTDMTRETLVKIERGTHHITASQLRAIRDILGTTYDELLKE